MARSLQSVEQRQQIQQENAQQHRVARSQMTVIFKIALQPVTDTSVELYTCGRRSHVCQYCHALKWQPEVQLGSICCFFGQSCVLTQLFPSPFPQPLQDLLTFDLSSRENPCVPPTLIRNFRHNIRQYNCALQMASSQIKIANPPQGISMIAIKGAIHHLIGPLVPAQDEQHQFAQLYIIDNHDTQVNLRMSHLGGADSKLNNEVLRMLQNMLHQYNPFVQQFRQVIDMINDNDRLIEYQIMINTDGSVDHRRYNRPTGHGQDELAGYIPGDEVNVTTDHRSIQIRARGIQNDATHGLQYISDIHCNYASMLLHKLPITCYFYTSLFVL